MSLAYIAFIVVSYISTLHNFFRTFIMKEYLTFLKDFCASTKVIM